MPDTAEMINRQDSMEQVLPVTSVKDSVTAPPSPRVVSNQERKFNSALVNAVNDVNQSGYLGDGREITFGLDPATKQAIIRVVDSQTKEVIQQWPPEYLLELARSAITRKPDSR